jgi:hypothetical protein
VDRRLLSDPPHDSEASAASRSGDEQDGHNAEEHSGEHHGEHLGSLRFDQGWKTGLENRAGVR